MINEWISVKDRLPEKEGEYLVTRRSWEKDRRKFVTAIAEYGFEISPDNLMPVKNPRIFENGAAFGEKWYDGMDNLDEVTAWMPLPEPYEEDDYEGPF